MIKNPKTSLYLTILFLFVFIFSSCHIKKENHLKILADSRKTTLGLYVTALEAHDMIIKNNDILFLDVRTRAEVAFLGMPAFADTNIPYMLVGDSDEWDKKKSTFKIYPNSNFLPYFKDYMQSYGFNKNTLVIAICRSGNRSAKAVNLLAKVGYTNIYTVTDGFEGSTKTNGWKNNGLPWSNKLDQNKMYQEGF